MSGERPQKFQSLTGMRDVMWPDSARRRELVDRFALMCSAAAYREIVPPLLEDLGVFQRVGEATDVVTKEMYEFTDRDGTRVALRPEMTAGVVRAFVQYKPPTPWKVFYAGTNFRHERPQKGRYRSFDQLGVEVLGIDDPDLDVEVIALAWDYFASVGLRQVTLSVNSLGEHEDRERYTAAIAGYFADHSSELSEASRETLERNPLRILDSKRREERSVVEGAPRITEFLSVESAAHFTRVREGLDALGVPYTLDERLVRGLDYYRRTTFEFAVDALDAAQNAIGGGGRYDGLAEDLGGKPTDGIGFALGVDRILLAAEAEGILTEEQATLDAYVVDLTDGSHARDIAHELRTAGLTCDRRFGGGSMKAQMKAADRSGAQYAVIVGEDEAAAGEVTLRRLRGHGDTAGDSAQERVTRTELVAMLVAEERGQEL
ncbi:MAG: histidine--tRNA ligase [Microthrixaceae bacterium]